MRTLKATKVQIAVVSDPTRIKLITVARSRERLYGRLAAYVSREAEVQLYPELARRVRQLLGTGDCEAAIALYFASVGERWDEESLSIRTMALE